MSSGTTATFSGTRATTYGAKSQPESAWRPVDLQRLLKGAAAKMGGIAALKTRYRPYVCPLEWILPEIPPASRLYDIGCGSGALLYLALKCRGVSLAHGCDVDPLGIRNSSAFQREMGDAFRIQRMPAPDCPPDLSGYDTITMVDVLHHIPPTWHQGFLKRLAASMTSGAQLICKDIDAARRVGLVMNQLHDLILARQWVHCRSRERTVAMIEAAGLRVVRHQTRWTLWYPHFLITAVKPG